MTTALTNYSEQQVPVDLSDDGTWGPPLLGALSLFDRALAGVVIVTMTSGNVTLDATQAQNGHLVAIGTPGGANTIFIPAKSRSYRVRNALTAAQTVKVQIVGGLNSIIRVPYQSAMTIYCDGTDTWATSPPVRFTGGAPDSIEGKPGIYFETDVGCGLFKDSVGLQIWGGGSLAYLRASKYNDANNPALAFSESGGGFGMGFFAVSDATMAWATGGTEVWRSDASNFYVGRTVTSNDTTGAFISTTGKMCIERSGGGVMELNRYGDTGGVVTFYHGKTNIVGSISVTASATSYGVSSDRDLKDQIEDAPDLWALIHAVPVRMFEFKREPGRKVVGLIAQEAYEPWQLFAGAVTGTPERDLERDDPMGVDASKAVPGLLWAVQDLDRRMRAHGL